jgi:hypothetical protein
MPARRFLNSRRALVLTAALAACLVRAYGSKPPEPTVEGLSELLADAVGGTVKNGDLAWEPSPGFLAETFRGRPVLFLASQRPGQPRDLYRAYVRVTLDGKPVSVERVRNLTETPDGDDTALETRGDKALFATLAFGRIQAISVLDLPGIRASDRPASLLDRVLLGLSSFQETGSFAGIGRTDIVLDVPAQKATIELEPPRLAVDFGEQGRELLYDLERRVVRSGEGGEAYAARAVPQIHGSKPFVFWAVDTVRAEVGPGPIAWLENVVFGAKDSVKKTTYALLSSPSEHALETRPQAAVAQVLDARKVEALADSWPPPRVPSIWKQPKSGEGAWEPVTYPFLKPMRGLAENGKKPIPYFYRTVIRPDPERPYSEVMLIAMDMRQLELGMQAGYEDPKPTTGPPGEGRLSQDPAVYERVVATFNGAFKTTHGNYGMMIDRRVLLPPVPGGASVVVTDSGTVGLGSWPQNGDVPANITSYRQNLDPLVEDGVANPTGRNIWGWQLDGASVMTQRTALCVTSAGHLYYAWSEEIDGPTLGKALRQAGCSYAIHLDMNPGHCGFMFTDVVNPREGKYQLKLASDAMKMSPDRYVRWSPKDFFYVMVRDATPRDGSGVLWKPDDGTQPPPAWLPGVYTGQLSLGQLEVQLVSFEPGHAQFRLKPSALEPGVPATAREQALTDASDRVLAALGLGHTTDATRYGLRLGKTPELPFRSAYATLVLGTDGALRVVAPGTLPELAEGEQAAQLPLLAEGAKITDRARERGDLRLRAALGVTPNGRVIVALARHDSSDPLASALVRAGSERVVELDRGSHHPSFLHRAGSATPPMDSYEATTLYVVARPMIPRAFRWKAEGSAPSTKVTSYDYPAPADSEAATRGRPDRGDKAADEKESAPTTRVSAPAVSEPAVKPASP